MTFLDTSVVIDMLEEVPETVEYVEAKGTPYLTSSICIFEVLNGRVGAGETDIVAARQDFGGVKSLDFTDQLAREAARMQDALIDDGERMSPREIMIAATARSTGDELVVADSDFETEHLQDLMTVTNLRN